MPLNSKLNLKWVFYAQNQDIIKNISEKNPEISPFLIQLLINRGILNIDDIMNFLAPSPKINLPPSPYTAEIASLLKQAIFNHDRITVYGDYDADGITSTALLTHFLKKLKANVDSYLPSRFKDGYGLHSSVIKNLAKQGTKILITVDCGISNHKEINLAKELGITVIVTDHHHISDSLPPADFVINPKISKCDRLDIMAGVGVTFQLVKSLAEYFQISKTFIADYLDLVTLGTIADIVPLIGINRNIIKRGLHYIRKSKREGFAALCRVANIQQQELDIYNIAFQLTPRLNASGRMYDPSVALSLLLTDKADIANELARNLNMFNQKRQKLCDEIFEQAQRMIMTEIDLINDKAIILAKEGWHHGIIGIVASKLAELYYKPVFLIALELGKGVGSARSSGNFNIFEALSAASIYLERYGGHQGAGGLSIKQENIPLFKEKIFEYALKTFKEEDLIPSIKIDMPLKLNAVSFDLIKDIEQLEPFGNSNPCPTFASYKVKVIDPKTSKDGKHLLFRVADNNAQSYKATFWNKGNLYPLPETIDIAYFLKLNTFKGETNIQLDIVDIKQCQGD